MGAPQCRSLGILQGSSKHDTFYPGIPTGRCTESARLEVNIPANAWQRLLKLRNYHSLTAILSGLHKYSVTEASVFQVGKGSDALVVKQVLPPELLSLLEPYENFAAYRHQFQQAPGIPFLIPHLNEADQNGPFVLQHLHAQLRAVITKW